MKRILLMFLCVLLCGVAQAQTVAKVEPLLKEYVQLRDSDPQQALKKLIAAAEYRVKEDPELSLLAAWLQVSYFREKNFSKSRRDIAWTTTAGRAVSVLDTQKNAGLVLASALAMYETVGSIRIQFKPLYLLKALHLFEGMPGDLSVIYQGPPAKWYRLAGLDQYDLPRIEALQQEIRQQLSEYTGRQLVESSVATQGLKSMDDDERSWLAVRLACMAMEKDDPDSYALLGDYIEKGWMEEKEGMQRAELYRISAGKGSGWGASRYACCYPEGTSLQEIYACLSALEDHPDLIRYGGGMRLAEWLESGFGGKPDLLRAESLYIQTSESGGTKSLREEAYKNYRRIFLQRERQQLMASLTEEMASLTADELCARGDAFEHLEDPETALWCYEKANEQGSLRAKNLLALIYEEEGDPEKAVSMFADAAEKGHLPALYNLAMCLYLGRGIFPDILLADKYTELYLKRYNEGEYNHFERRELLSRNHQKHLEQVPKDILRRGIEMYEVRDLGAWANWLLELRCKVKEELEGELLRKLSKEFTTSQAYMVLANRHEYAGKYEEALYYYRCLQKSGYKEANAWVRELEERIKKSETDASQKDQVRGFVNSSGARQRREIINTNQSYKMLSKIRKMAQEIE